MQTKDTSPVSSKKVTITDLQRIRARCEDKVKKFPLKPELKKGRVLEIVKELQYELKPDILTDWIDMGFVNPEVEPGDRNTHLYGRIQLVEILLTHELHLKNGIPYTKILSLLLNEAREKNSPTSASFSQSDIGLPEQKDRAIVMLRSRIFGIILTWLLGKSIPANTHVFLRKNTQTLPTIERGKAKLQESCWMKREKAQASTGVIRSDDIIGVVSPEMEVLFTGFSYKSILDSPPGDWLSLTLLLGEPGSEYMFLLGFDRNYCDPQSIKINIREDIPEDINILGLLLSLIYAQGVDTEPSEQEKQIHTTALHSLAEIIPTLSPHWEYCAILSARMNKRKQLEIKAASHTFPKDLLNNLSTLLIEFGQPLSGWAIESDYPIKVQQIAPDESWPVFQEIEKAWAGAAIPTHANGKNNGILYIGTTKANNRNERIFDDADMRMLQILSEVLGELIERRLIRESIETNALRVINKPPLITLPWDQLFKDFHQALERLRDQNVGETDNLHLTVIKTSIEEDTARKHPGILSWYSEHVLSTTWEFFYRNYPGQPSVYFNDPYKKEFAIFIPDVQISSSRDRELRSELKNLLSSLQIMYSPGDSARATAYLWTIPFRKDLMKSRLFGTETVGSLNDYAKRIVKDAQELFVLLPLREQAHEMERSKNYREALRLYMLAWSYSKSNTYLIRHIAKVYELLGDYENSIHWWNSLIEKECSAYPLVRCARVHALAKNYPEALRLYQKAWDQHLQESQYILGEVDLSPHYPGTQEILMYWADTLVATENYEAAINKYQDALMTSSENRDELWLCIADASARKACKSKSQQDLDFARENNDLVLKSNPENHQAWRMKLQLSNIHEI